MICYFCNSVTNDKLSFKNLFSKNEKMYLCPNCSNELTIKQINSNNFQLFYFADYSFLKDIIHKIKYRGDVRMVEKFKPLFAKFLKQYSFDLITVVPSNTIRSIIRGENHIETICKLCSIPYTPTLYCHYRKKQAKLKKTRTPHSFYMLDNIKITKEIKTILIIDDIFTSGLTLVACKKVLEQHFPNVEITFLTLAYSSS